MRRFVKNMIMVGTARTRTGLALFLDKEHPQKGPEFCAGGWQSLIIGLNTFLLLLNIIAFVFIFFRYLKLS